MKRSRVMRRALLVVALGATAQTHATECFSMFDAKNALVYQSTTTPINLSRPISDQMARYFPARYLVISDVGTCAEAGAGSGSSSSSAGERPIEGPAVYGADATSPAPVVAPQVAEVPARRSSRGSAASRR